MFVFHPFSLNDTHTSTGYRILCHQIFSFIMLKIFNLLRLLLLRSQPCLTLISLCRECISLWFFFFFFHWIYWGDIGSQIHADLKCTLSKTPSAYLYHMPILPSKVSSHPYFHPPLPTSAYLPPPFPLAITTLSLVSFNTFSSSLKCCCFYHAVSERWIYFYLFHFGFFRFTKFVG